jgi:hypothetical protein
LQKLGRVAATFGWTTAVFGLFSDYRFHTLADIKIFQIRIFQANAQSEDFMGSNMHKHVTLSSTCMGSNWFKAIIPTGFA